MPNQGETYSDHRVEGRPDRAENPIRRVARRRSEGRKPCANGAGGEEGSEAAQDFHDDNAKDNFGGERAEHGGRRLRWDLSVSTRSWESEWDLK